MRSPFIALACLFAVIGYAILIAAPSLVARYIGLLFIAVGLYPSTALNLAWCSGNAAGHFKRATASGTMQAIGERSLYGAPQQTVLTCRQLRGRSRRFHFRHTDLAQVFPGTLRRSGRNGHRHDPGHDPGPVDQA